MLQPSSVEKNCQEFVRPEIIRGGTALGAQNEIQDTTIYLVPNSSGDISSKAYSVMLLHHRRSINDLQHPFPDPSSPSSSASSSPSSSMIRNNCRTARSPRPLSNLRPSTRASSPTAPLGAWGRATVIAPASSFSPEQQHLRA